MKHLKRGDLLLSKCKIGDLWFCLLVGSRMQFESITGGSVKGILQIFFLCLKE